MVNESNCKDYTKLKILRQERGMTQAQLAEAIGVEQKTISNIETGRFSPSMHTLEGLAKAIVGTLREARFYDDDIKKISILRRCFFFLYDNLTLLADDNHYYDVLSDIVIILADVEFCVSERRHLFYTCLQCAEQMSIDYRRKGGETE